MTTDTRPKRIALEFQIDRGADAALVVSVGEERAVEVQHPEAVEIGCRLGSAAQPDQPNRKG